MKSAMIVIIFAAVVSSGFALRCYDCDDTQPGPCNKTVECSGSNMSCFTGEDRRGCSSCNGTTNGTTTPCCDWDRCCDWNRCNNRTLTTPVMTVGTSPLPTTTPITPPKTPVVQTNGLRCYFCSQSSPGACTGPPEKTVKKCSVGEVCRAVVTFRPPLGPIPAVLQFFGQDCFNASTCQESNACANASSAMATTHCIKCCDCDLCNNATVVLSPVPGISVETCSTKMATTSRSTKMATTSPSGSSSSTTPLSLFLLVAAVVANYWLLN